MKRQTFARRNFAGGDHFIGIEPSAEFCLSQPEWLPRQPEII
jgi:hypothetical protein